MYKTKFHTSAIIFTLLLIACSTQNTFDGVYPKSSIGIHFGSIDDLYSSVQNSDSTFTEIDYNMTGLREVNDRVQSTLEVDVEHAGGEGGCPTHKFFIQWDNTLEADSTGNQKTSLGLAGFLVNSNVTCEALVRETLEFDLNEIFGTQLGDINQINVTNLSSLEQDSLIRAD